MSACVALRGASCAFRLDALCQADATLSMRSTVRHDTSRSMSGVMPASSAFRTTFAAGHHSVSLGGLAVALPPLLASLASSEGGTKKRLHVVEADLPPDAVVRLVNGNSVERVIRKRPHPCVVVGS